MTDGIDFPGYGRKPVLQQLAISRFDPARQAWLEERVADPDCRVTRVSLATYNTWFQGEDRDTRYRGLLDVLQKCGADVIMLQEVTMQLLDAILAAPWARSAYCFARAPFRADAVPSHGVMLLSRLPIRNARLHPIPTRMGRSLLTADTRVNGERFVLATVHLESMKLHADTRGEQLAAIFSLLDAEQNVLLAGDFNFCSSSREENGRIDRRYTDVWPAVRPGEPGFTQDTDVNLMLAHAKGEAKKVRIDRILLRNDRREWAAQSAFLLGTGPVDPKRPRIFPSDHFGVGALISLTGTTL